MINCRFVSSLFVLILFIFFSSCSGGSSTPRDLAENVCNCWNEMKTLDNQTAKARKADECSLKTQNALAQLREIGVDKNWSNQQVGEAQKEFDSVYKNCQ